MYTMRFVYTLLLSLICGWGAMAQTWQPDWSRADALLNGLWRHDIEHFAVSNGALVLNAPAGRAHSVISTSVQLGDRVQWSGKITTEQMPSPRNYILVLLSCTAYDLRANTFDFLALALGGKYRDTVALAIIRLSKTPSGYKYITWRGERTIISHEGFPSTLSSGMRYIVRYDAAGELSLLLNASKSGHLVRVGEASATLSFVPHNSFGFYCAYSPARRTGVRFSEISITNHWEEEGEAQKEPNDLPEKEHEVEVGSPWISEIMANPLENSPEYIELYNPHKAALPLTNIKLGVGTDESKIRHYALDMLPPIAPESYIVLTSNPSALQRSYPQARGEHIVTFALPRLRNAGCHIRLLSGDEVCDSLHYTPSLMDKGLKSRRGIALERTAWVKNTGQTGLWRSATKDAGYATPTRANSHIDGASAPSTQSEAPPTLSELISRMETAPDLSVSAYLYNSSGKAYTQLIDQTAREWIAYLYASPHAALRSVGAPTRQSYIAYIEVGGERYAFKFGL